MMKCYNDALAGMLKDGVQRKNPRMWPQSSLEALTNDAPRLRYQSSFAASAMAARNIADVTHHLVLQATRPLVERADADRAVRLASENASWPTVRARWLNLAACRWALEVLFN